MTRHREKPQLILYKKRRKSTTQDKYVIFGCEDIKIEMSRNKSRMMYDASLVEPRDQQHHTTAAAQATVAEDDDDGEVEMEGAEKKDIVLMMTHDTSLKKQRQALGAGGGHQ